MDSRQVEFEPEPVLILSTFIAFRLSRLSSLAHSNLANITHSDPILNSPHSHVILLLS